MGSEKIKAAVIGMGPHGRRIVDVVESAGVAVPIMVGWLKPVIVLPGFPTSAIFTFHTFVAPVIRARAGRP